MNKRGHEFETERERLIESARIEDRKGESDVVILEPQKKKNKTNN